MSKKKNYTEVLYDIESKQRGTAMEKWEAWWKLSSDHYCEPVSLQTWNGAVDTMCNYFYEVMCGTEIDFDELQKIVKKARKKFKS